MKKYARLVFIYFRVLCRVFVLYSKEIIFFISAKRKYIINNGKDYNPALILRKRTHHLEKALFFPKKQGGEYAIAAIKDIKYILKNSPERISPALKAWSNKILFEYEKNIIVNSDRGCICPMQMLGVQWKKEVIGIDSVIGLMRQRRSRRIFESVKLTDNEKRLICESAQLIPSSCNRQPLHLLFVEDEELKKYIASTINGGKEFFANAPAIILIIADVGDYCYPEDRVTPFIEGGSAVQNIYLVCESLGLGCCVGSYTSFGSLRKEKEVRKKLGVPSDFLVITALAVGKSNQFVCPIPRDEIESKMHMNFYGNR